MDDEIKGEGNSVNYKYRMHDPRIGRFFAVDPLTPKYPHYTPYSFSGNKVIHAVELEGLEERVVTYKPTESGSISTDYRDNDKDWNQDVLDFYGQAQSTDEYEWIGDSYQKYHNMAGNYWNDNSPKVHTPRKGTVFIDYGGGKTLLRYSTSTRIPGNNLAPIEPRPATPRGSHLDPIRFMFNIQYAGESRTWEQRLGPRGQAFRSTVFNYVTTVGMAPIGAISAEYKYWRTFGPILPDREIISVIGGNKPGTFLLRNVDYRPIGNMIYPGKSGSIAQSFDVYTEVAIAFGRGGKRGDVLLQSTVGDIRAAGFNVFRAPTYSNPYHVRITSGTNTFDAMGTDWLNSAFQKMGKVNKTRR